MRLLRCSTGDKTKILEQRHTNHRQYFTLSLQMAWHFQIPIPPILPLPPSQGVAAVTGACASPVDVLG